MESTCPSFSKYKVYSLGSSSLVPEPNVTFPKVATIVDNKCETVATSIYNMLGTLINTNLNLLHSEQPLKAGITILAVGVNTLGETICLISFS